MALRSEATTLLNYLKTSISDGDVLHNQILVHAEEERAKRASTLKLNDRYSAMGFLFSFLRRLFCDCRTFRCDSAVRDLEDFVRNFNTKLVKTHEVCLTTCHCAEPTPIKFWV